MREPTAGARMKSMSPSGKKNNMVRQNEDEYSHDYQYKINDNINLRFVCVCESENTFLAKSSVEKLK